MCFNDSLSGLSKTVNGHTCVLSSASGAEDMEVIWSILKAFMESVTILLLFYGLFVCFCHCT